eukprot:8971777-Pyramimonas_sp.AAC.1
MAHAIPRWVAINSDMPPSGPESAPRRHLLFVSDGLWRPQDGPKMPRTRHKRGPNGAAGCPTIVQEALESAPTRPRDAV